MSLVGGAREGFGTGFETAWPFQDEKMESRAHRIGRGAHGEEKCFLFYKNTKRSSLRSRRSLRSILVCGFTKKGPR